MQEKIIHTHHDPFFKTWHMFALLVPSIVFALLLSFFSRTSYVKNSAATIVVATQTPRISITVRDVDIQATIADDENSLAVGLANHDYLAPNEGMLFVFNRDNIRPPFWMKGMSIPIDILWIDDKKIVQIDANVQPEPEENFINKTYKLFTPNQEVDYVLEVSAGFSETHAIQIGDPVSFEIF